MYGTLGVTIVVTRKCQALSFLVPGVLNSLQQASSFWLLAIGLSPTPSASRKGQTKKETC